MSFIPRLRGALVAVALAGGLCVPAVPAHARPAPKPFVVAVDQPAARNGERTVRHPLMLQAHGRDARGRPLVATGAPGGYTAAQLRAAVGLKGTGKGQTVAIVTAFDDPYAVQELNAYSDWMGLPPVCTRKNQRNCVKLTHLHPDGVGGMDPGWAVETALDLEMVHALAPEANILLVQSFDNTFDSMFRAVEYAASMHPAVISNSWGLDGEVPEETEFDDSCLLTDGLCLFATGDSGHPGGYPAYNPHVLAVGGTTLSLDRSGKVLAETAWQGGGGGISQFEPRPDYQPESINPSANRGIPDVSFVADPLAGVAVYSAVTNGWVRLGGTSVATPAWAGILAAADQLRAAAGKPALTTAGHQAQRAIYGLTSGLADVTEGTNGTCGALCTAGPGYDFATGLGSPRPGIDTALAAAP